MWIVHRPVPPSPHLVLGCGDANRHPSLHPRAVTMDRREEMQPHILGDLTQRVDNAALMHRFALIACEYLPYYVYHDPVFYANLRYLRAPDCVMLVLGLPIAQVPTLRRMAAMHRWQLERLRRLAELPPVLRQDRDFCHFVRVSLSRAYPHPTWVIV